MSSENGLHNGNEWYNNEENLIDSSQHIHDEREITAITSPNNDTKNKSYHERRKNLTMELTAPQLFVKELLFIIKKQLKEIGNIQKPAE